MLGKESPPFFVASSAMAQEAEPNRFALLPTAEYAAVIGADGTQSFINLKRFHEGLDDPVHVLETHQRLGLQQITHLPGEFTLTSLQNEGEQALQIAATMADPLPDLGGVVGITHHNAFSSDSYQSLANTLYTIFDEIKSQPKRPSPNMILGLENFYPKDLTTNQNLPEQIRKYGELLHYLQDQGLPVVPVLDLNRLHSRGKDEEQLEDPGDTNLTELVKISAGQRLIVHASDKVDPLLSHRTEGNAVPIGEGYFTQKYQFLTKLAQQYGTDLVCVVDESEKKLITNNEELEKAKSLFETKD